MLSGTPITLADGTEKLVEMIQVGDQVLAYNESTRAMQPSQVISVSVPFTVDHYYLINRTIRVTDTHPMLSKGQWVVAADLTLGEVLTSLDGRQVPVFSKEKVVGTALVYNFGVAAGTYVANGVIVHNKEDCQYYEQYFPQ
jgi:hypothetical protein